MALRGFEARHPAGAAGQDGAWAGACALASAAAGSAIATPWCGRLARRVGLVDRPGPLKVQQAPVPYLGGLGVLAGLVASSSTGARAPGGRRRVALPLVAALALGVGDDWRDLPVAVRVLGEVGAGLALARATPTRFGAAGWPLVVATELLLVNGVNLLDGLDGLSGSVVAASCAGLAAGGDGAGRVEALAGLGAVAGFLAHNRPPARIYLGDAGSYLLGTLLAALVAASWQDGRSPATSLGACLAVSVPAAEVTWAIIRRYRSGLALFAGDRGHSYDRLAARGWPLATIAAAAGALQLALGLAGAGAARRSTRAAATAVAATAAALLGGAAATGLLSPLADEGGVAERQS